MTTAIPGTSTSHNFYTSSHVNNYYGCKIVAEIYSTDRLILTTTTSDTRDRTSLWTEGFHRKEPACLINGLNVAVLVKNMRPALKVLSALLKVSKCTTLLGESFGVLPRLPPAMYGALHILFDRFVGKIITVLGHPPS